MIMSHESMSAYATCKSCEQYDECILQGDDCIQLCSFYVKNHYREKYSDFNFFPVQQRFRLRK